jgi:hypothetical protein
LRELRAVLFGEKVAVAEDRVMRAFHFPGGRVGQVDVFPPGARQPCPPAAAREVHARVLIGHGVLAVTEGRMDEDADLFLPPWEDQDAARLPSAGRHGDPVEVG